MSNYRRVYIPGGTYFFTLVTYRHQPIIADGKPVEQLRQSFRKVKAKRSFDLLAAVVLPDHLHCLWRLPEDDADFSTRWQMVKTSFSRRIPAKTQAGRGIHPARNIFLRYIFGNNIAGWARFCALHSFSTVNDGQIKKHLPILNLAM